MENCPICSNKITFFPDESGGDFYEITCHTRCGEYILTRNALDKLQNKPLSIQNIANISGFLFENQGTEIDVKRLESLINLNSPSFYEKVDKLLLYLEKESQYAGALVHETVKLQSVGWCANHEEFNEIINFLGSTNRIQIIGGSQGTFYKILPEGWAQLEKYKNTKSTSNQCFVAMWFNPEMDEAYDKAIKKAIEFIEEGESSPRFKAIKINNVEHINDINDEIIGQIRRSRFMVCDLTGYRGGVYFEAGFAYGLGLDVIYTCRTDWIDDEVLQNDSGQPVKFLVDSNNKHIAIRKEGVHFDLAHRNRIEWSPDNLEDFKEKLEKRIKSVIKINN